MSDREIKCPVCKCIMTEPEEWPRPIPVSERLPEWGEAVLLFGQWSRWHMGHRTKDHRGLHVWKYDDQCYGDPDIKPTHWLPLPPKPE